MLESEEIESPNSSGSFNRTVRGEGGGRAGSGFQASSRVAQASSCRLRASQVMGEDNPSGKRSGEDGASGNSVTPHKDMTTPNRAGAGEEIVSGARRQVSAILSTSSSSRGRKRSRSREPLPSGQRRRHSKGGSNRGRSRTQASAASSDDPGSSSKKVHGTRPKSSRALPHLEGGDHSRCRLVRSSLFTEEPSSSEAPSFSRTSGGDSDGARRSSVRSGHHTDRSDSSSGSSSSDVPASSSGTGNGDGDDGGTQVSNFRW